VETLPFGGKRQLSDEVCQKAIRWCAKHHNETTSSALHNLAVMNSTMRTFVRKRRNPCPRSTTSSN